MRILLPHVKIDFVMVVVNCNKEVNLFANSVLLETKRYTHVEQASNLDAL